VNTKNHLPNRGSFRKGQADKRRNTHGQKKAAAVALGALLKQYLEAEGSLSAGKNKGTKARQLAVVIWERALLGDFQYVQFLADRFMGKVKETSTAEDQEAIDKQLARIADGIMLPAMQA
jgi:hypothetical protein